MAHVSIAALGFVQQLSRVGVEGSQFQPTHGGQGLAVGEVVEFGEAVSMRRVGFTQTLAGGRVPEANAAAVAGRGQRLAVRSEGDAQDIIGTGKTAAFLLPILHQLLDLPGGTTRALVITPTRELA
jgi:hypothetical protein